MNINFEVVHLHDANREVVDKLVREHGAELIVLASVNKSYGRSEQATLCQDGHVLAAITQNHAEELGLQPGRAPHVILAMPEGCELAETIMDRIDRDSCPIEIDLEDVE